MVSFFDVTNRLMVHPFGSSCALCIKTLKCWIDLKDGHAIASSIMISFHCTQMRLTSFPSGQFYTVAIVNPPEGKLVNPTCSLYSIAIQVVEFSSGGYKIRKIFAQEPTYLPKENY